MKEIQKERFGLVSLFNGILTFGGARGVMVIVENGYDDTSSNPGRDWLCFP